MHLRYAQKNNGMYILKRTDIDDIATGVLRENMPHVLEYAQPVDIAYLAQECYYLSIKKQCIAMNGAILGLVAFGKTEVIALDDMYCPVNIEVEEATMLIDKTLFWGNRQQRLNFTIGHETSHWLLHRSYHSPTNQQFQLRTSSCRNKYIACRSDNIECGKKRNLITDNYWEEWQADCLSAALLMPIQAFDWAVRNAFRNVGISGKHIIKDPSSWHYSNRNEYEVKMYLSGLFKVSVKAVEIRMAQLDCIGISI